MLPDLVRHPSFLIFGTFLSNLRDDLFLRENKVSLNPIHRTHPYSCAKTKGNTLVHKECTRFKLGVHY